VEGGVAQVLHGLVVSTQQVRVEVKPVDGARVRAEGDLLSQLLLRRFAFLLVLLACVFVVTFVVKLGGFLLGFTHPGFRQSRGHDHAFDLGLPVVLEEAAPGGRVGPGV
jgi:hypothetical protein